MIRIAHLCVGLPRTYGDDHAAVAFDRTWTSAIVKDSVREPRWLSTTGLAGDAVADAKAHGGPDKAVLVGAISHLPFWRELLGRDDLGPGAFGENFVIEGALEGDVCIGDCFTVGEALVQISQPRQPCWKQARRWRTKDLPAQMQRTGRTGWYLRVQREGHVAPGDELRLVDRPHPEWTVARANDAMHQRPVDRAAASALAAIPQLAARWRDGLQRLADGRGADPTARLVGPNEG